jgi:hypothetical protein
MNNMPKAKSSSRKKRAASATAASRRGRRPRRAELGKRRKKAGAARTVRSAANRTRRTGAARKQKLLGSSPKKLCPSCRAVNPMAATVCAKCGAKLAKSAAAAAAAKRPAAKQAALPATGTVRPAKSRRTAILLEVIPAILGVFGLGWLYAGNRSIGLVWLIGMLIWDAFVVGSALFTGGAALYITLPISVLMIFITFITLNNYLGRNQDAFGFY